MKDLAHLKCVCVLAHAGTRTWMYVHMYASVYVEARDQYWCPPQFSTLFLEAESLGTLLSSSAQHRDQKHTTTPGI